MKVNIKQPRYVIPIIALPFFFLFFYIFNDYFKQNSEEQQSESLQEEIADVSDEIKNRALSDKLAAYKNQYKNGDGYTALGQLQDERTNEFRFDNMYNEKEKRLLDSIENAFKSQQFSNYDNPKTENKQEQNLQKALSELSYSSPTEISRTTNNEDQMSLFRQQMALADSFAKAHDPEFQKQQMSPQQLQNSKSNALNSPALKVSKYIHQHTIFNTITKDEHEPMIQAIIDENRTAYADSRLRIRLLDDLQVGDYKIEKGTFLYAKVSGFSAQRVKLSVNSLMYKGKILPVHIVIYDQDGVEGLYIPESAFRDFSRELGVNTSQGITINQQAENNAQLLMSTLQRMFQSTSSAVSKHIRKNKAKIKYNSIIYLIDYKQVNSSL